VTFVSIADFIFGLLTFVRYKLLLQLIYHMNHAIFSSQEHSLLIALSDDRTSGIDLEILALQIESLKGLVEHIDIPETELSLTATSDNLLLLVIANIVNRINRIGVASTLQSAFEERGLFGPAVPQHNLPRIQSPDYQMGVQGRNRTGGDRGVAAQNVLDFGTGFHGPDQQKSRWVVYVSSRVRGVTGDKLFSLKWVKRYVWDRVDVVYNSVLTYLVDCVDIVDYFLLFHFVDPAILVYQLL
jgi:hypothetical protein